MLTVVEFSKLNSKVRSIGLLFRSHLAAYSIFFSKFAYCCGCQLVSPSVFFFTPYFENFDNTEGVFYEFRPKVSTKRLSQVIDPGLRLQTELKIPNLASEIEPHKLNNLEKVINLNLT